MIDYNVVSTFFYYDETSPSCLRWKLPIKSGVHLSRTNVNIGDVAGSVGSDGYWKVGFCKGHLRVSRIIWTLHNKTEPKFLIDHIDGDILDNRISNLRDVHNVINRRNTKMNKNNISGITGVCKYGSKYCAHYRDLEGNNIKRSFSILKYGEDVAFELACEFRLAGIEEMNALGAGYSDRHGKA